MSNLKNRILGDRGFIGKMEKPSNDALELEVKKLRTENDKLKKKLRDKDEMVEKQRSVEHIKLTDKMSALEKEMRLLRNENDKLKGKNAQLEKELKEKAE